MSKHTIELAQIVSQASSLSERINMGLCDFHTNQTYEQDVTNQRLVHWCEVVAEGDWTIFQLRLQQDGLNIETARQLLEKVPDLSGQELPPWAETLNEIMQRAKSFPLEEKVWDFSPFKDQTSNGPLDPENPLPFEDILLPALSIAHRRLLVQLEALSLTPDDLSLGLLSETSYFSLLRSVLQKLSELCGSCLEEEFSRFRPLGYNLLNLMVGEYQSGQSNAYYTAFVRQLLEDGLLTFCQRYPVLGRLIATCIDFWVEATAEFLQRLKADNTRLQHLFHNSTKPEKVIAISASLSDAHDQGRSVMICTFASGLKLVYKPRNLHLAVAYNHLLDWCNRQRDTTLFFQENQDHPFLPFKVLKVLSCQGYGWIEYVEHHPCEDDLAVQRFYQRTGMLLCLFHILRGTDCHYENIIASGEYPVVVDLETLLDHEPGTMTDSLVMGGAESYRYALFKNSVVRTALLPYWAFHKDYSFANDLSGLGSTTPQEASVRIAKWWLINTDDMYSEYETVIKPVKKNVALLHGKILSGNDYVEEITSGFQQFYRGLRRWHDDLLAADGPLTAFKGYKARYIFRATSDYGVLLRYCLAPEFLGSGIDYSIELDRLSQNFLPRLEPSPDWGILRAEIQAVEQLDYPYFEAYTDSDALLVGSDQIIQEYFREPSYSQVLRYIQQLSQTDLAWQVMMIHGKFAASVAESTHSSSDEMVTADLLALASSSFLERPQTSHPDYTQLLTAAHEIALEIQSQAIAEADGSVYWVGFSAVSNSERLQFMPLDDSLYNGNCGIALFLAALDYATENNQFRDLALAALQPTQKMLQAANKLLAERIVKTTGIGGAIGLGSTIYSLVKIGHLLRVPALTEDALRAAHIITIELIATDQHLDVLRGVAGTILGLLALYQETKEQVVLDKAIACGQHLLKNRIRVDGSPRAWKTSEVEERPSIGFLRGAAGIAYALSRLYEQTHNGDFLEAACEGIAYGHETLSVRDTNQHDSHFSAQYKNTPGFMSWCHGIPGIMLARLGSLTALDTAEIQQEVAGALQVMPADSMQKIDHLCCGNLGWSEALLVASEKLAHLDLLTMARQRAERVVARARLGESYQLFANQPRTVFSPSFFQGTSGIGYELLRLAYPDMLSSVLLWQ